MANSLQYAIGLDMLTDLKLIKTAGGYNYNVPDANIEMAKTITKLPSRTTASILLHILESTPNEEHDEVQDEWYRYMVAFYNVHTATDGNVDLYVDNGNVVADVMKALRVDWTRGGLSLTTEKLDSGHDLDFDINWPFTYVNVRCQVMVNASNYYVNA